MRRLALAIPSLTLMVGLLLSAGTARGQVPTDYPNLKGTNERTGRNGDPRNSTPGFLRTESTTQPSSLRWFRTGGGLFDVAIDNTDDGDPNQIDENGAVVGPFDSQPNGTITRAPAVANLSARRTGGLSPAAGWAVVSNDVVNVIPNEFEASFLYVPSRRTQIIGTFTRDFNPRFAAYEFTETVPSSPGRDPRAGATRRFSWTFNAGGTPRNLALYVSLPVGITRFAGIDRIQQRYFVYEIAYGANRRYVDVVDTDAAGAGFVRLGGGGRATDAVFPTDGVSPVTITLFNTIPRDRITGNLLQTARDTNGNPRVVYADAARFTDNTSSLFATPTAAGFGGADRRVVAARNDSGLLAQVADNDFLTLPVATPRATVTSHAYNTGVEAWTYTPDESSPENAIFDDGNATVTPSAGFTQTNGRNNPTVNANPGNVVATYGGTYLRGIVVPGQVVLNDLTTSADDVVPVGTENVLVNPGAVALEPERTYEITTFVSGLDPANNNTPPVARAVQYEILEGTRSSGLFTLDTGGTRGFVRLGNRRYTHTVAAPLSVRFYNTSAGAEAGNQVPIDAVRFIGSLGNVVNSSPVHATALIRQDATNDPVPTNIVLIADERGRIHCLDASGNGDGTTKVYWTYPSTPTVSGQDTDGTPLYKDPNTNVGLGINDDGGEYDGEGNALQADMPPGFDLSTAAIVRQDLQAGTVTVQRDFLLIGGTNGRVYCIAMAGRGDLTATQPGTTFRRWTYPDTSPSLTATPSQFGRITSITTGLVGGTQKAYFGTELGRFFAVETLGADPVTNIADTSLNGPPQRRTRQVWQYPAGNVAPLGPIEGAPALDAANNRVFFGTLAEENTSGTVSPRFLSLNAATGAVNWGVTDLPVTPTAPAVTFGSWRSGPAYVPATELENADLEPPQGGIGTTPDSVYAMNENGYVYAINAATGATIWRTNELQSGGRGSLGYMRLTGPDRVGTTGTFPTITVPTEGGRFAALFARLGDETAFANFISDPTGPRLAWGARVGAPIVASMTTLGSPTGVDGFLYGASSDGILYAWSGNATGGGGGVFPPGYVEDITDNNTDPAFAGFRNAELALLSRAGYVRLRQTQTGTTRGNYAFNEVVDASIPAYSNPLGRLLAPYRDTRPVPPAFEWGETIYLILYNFPAPTVNANGDAIPPPQVEVTVTTEGRASRPILSEARIFRDRSEGSTDGGYAVVQVPLTSGGNTSLVPGPGLITATIRTSAGNNSFVQQAISLRPDRSRINYTVANPLALAMTNNTGGFDAYQIGLTPLASDPDNRVNGSPNVASAIAGRDSSKLGTSVGSVQHGQTGRTTIRVYDRSLMTLLRGEGRGLDNVRVDRRDLEWQGREASVAKGFQNTYGALFGKFEDLPSLLPNVSLDYPDVRRDRVSVTKDPAGTAENPLFNGVGLSGPRVGTGFVTDDNKLNRTLVATPFEFRVDVPRYQPPALVPDALLVPDSVGRTLESDGRTQVLPQGYAGRFSVFVDSDNNGIFGGPREAFRSFNLFGRVAPDERIVVTTPTVDLGALAGGAGYDPGLTYQAAAPYRGMGFGGIVSPWGGAYARLFQPFTVLNEGNINLLNVRVAKGSRDATAAGTVVFPWQTFSLLNDDATAWHDAALDLWSDLDENFAPDWGGGNQVIGKKPRVTDVGGAAVRANPTARLNPNVPNSGTELIPNLPSRDPRIGVTVPIGFPIGAYSQTFRIIEDFRAGITNGENEDEFLSLGYAADGRVDPNESYSDPGLRVAFTVTETQLTGGTSNLAARMVDGGTTPNPATGNISGWTSRQPAAARALNGSVAMVFSSNRPEWEPIEGTPPNPTAKYRLWISTLAGNVPGAPIAGFNPGSQTRDLNRFVPATGTEFWGRQVGGYPAASAATLFPAIPGAAGTPVEGTQSFGLPALPVTGFADPATYGTPSAAGFGAVTMAFVGNVERAGSANAVVDSRLFATRLSVAQNGAATVDPVPVAMPFDPTSRKGKPAVVESVPNGGAQGATIVYPVISGNASSLYVTRFNGQTFSQPIPIDLGTAFESAGEPSTSLRFQRGGAPVLEIAFAGRLRGRAGNEIFQMALLLDPATHLPIQPFRYVAYRVRGERAVFDAASGSYRVRGAYLREPGPTDANDDPDLFYDDRIFLRGNPNVADLRAITGRNAVVTTQLQRTPGTDYRIDRESRVESSASPILGGQIYLDRGAGSLRSVGGTLARTAEIGLDYDAYVIRLTGNDGAGYGSPTLMKDTRLGPSNTLNTYDAYWFIASGGPARIQTAAGPGDLGTTVDRTYALFTRAAQPGGQTTRPFLATTRFGIRLDRAILTNSDGSLAEDVIVEVLGDTGAHYQLDPAAGKIYFTRASEGRAVRVTFNGVTTTQAIGIIGERAEEPLPLGRAVNENNLTAFFDPVFGNVGAGDQLDRRALIWTFWSSTRSGAPNVFMGTISPKLVPFIPAR